MGRSDLYSLGCAMYHFDDRKNLCLSWRGLRSIRLGKAELAVSPSPSLSIFLSYPAQAGASDREVKWLAQACKDRYSSAIEASEALQKPAPPRGTAIECDQRSRRPPPPRHRFPVPSPSPKASHAACSTRKSFAKLDHSAPAAVQSPPEPFASLAISRFPAWFRPTGSHGGASSHQRARGA